MHAGAQSLAGSVLGPFAGGAVGCRGGAPQLELAGILVYDHGELALFQDTLAARVARVVRDREEDGLRDRSEC
jgi:hypothetical protein